MVRILTIAAFVGVAFSSAAYAQATGDGVICAIKRGVEVTSRAICKYEVASQPGCGGEGCGRVQRFTWPDGDVTVVENQEESFTLNGVDIDRDDFRINGLELCLTNASTGNSFCYDLQPARGG